MNSTERETALLAGANAVFPDALTVIDDNFAQQRVGQWVIRKIRQGG
jgi:hypothetical protein